jgi:hypothetical protein
VVSHHSVSSRPVPRNNSLSVPCPFRMTYKSIYVMYLGYREEFLFLFSNPILIIVWVARIILMGPSLFFFANVMHLHWCHAPTDGSHGKIHSHELGNDILDPITKSLSRQITSPTSGESPRVQLANLVDLFGSSIISSTPKLSVICNKIYLQLQFLLQICSTCFCLLF